MVDQSFRFIVGALSPTCTSLILGRLLVAHGFSFSRKSLAVASSAAKALMNDLRGVLMVEAHFWRSDSMESITDHNRTSHG